MSIQKIDSKHRAVARLLAMGIDKDQALDYFEIKNKDWWKSSIIPSPLFQEEVKRVEIKIEDRMVEEEIEDPVYQELKVAARAAVRRLAVEVDSAGEDSNAGTRIRAANSILDRTGYHGKIDTGFDKVVIALAQNQLDCLKSESPLPDQPESIKG